MVLPSVRSAQKTKPSLASSMCAQTHCSTPIPGADGRGAVPVVQALGSCLRTRRWTRAADDRMVAARSSPARADIRHGLMRYAGRVRPRKAAS